ncbi:MAG: helix-turn-helix domain-containing protein [Prevotellaceae bacterium]|jgi:transcriptional regulator with XRE-family HTH domain|nr:helix-turn-helix domain-containing protein [Prevotellaceae bacterium]
MKIQTPEYRVHHGRNVKRLREMLGIKQEAIAIALDLTQQAMSKLEQKEIIEDTQLDIIASVLRVPVAAIKNMSDETATNYINSFIDSDTMDDSHVNISEKTDYLQMFNPIDKIIELYNDKTELYERMLKIEREKIEILQKKSTEH